MSLFKILKGSSSRIDLNTTDFHDGYAYFTPDDGGFYIDSDDNGSEQRIRINPECVRLNQGVENAGKLLHIDTNGAVSPVGLTWGSLKTS